MKKALLILTISLSVNQFIYTQSIDANNVKAFLGSTNKLFNNPAMGGQPGYEVPKGSGLHTVFAATLWCAAMDDTNGLHLAGGRYNVFGSDYFSGPYSSTNSYGDPVYTSSYGNSIWNVTSVEIQNHIANYNQSGYVIPTNISSWPGNGISGLGVAQNLAPFIDLNNNSVYEPNLGEYPDIRGDEAYYIIMNDAKGIHTETGGEPLGIEVHTMVYQIVSSDYKNETTFLNYRVFNRGLNDYDNFKLGMWWDCVLGNAQDDYVGCDSSSNLMYVYNSDNLDDASGQSSGYGVNPPAFGITSLTKNLQACHFSAQGSSFPYGEPSSPMQYYYLMSGLLLDGSTMPHGGPGSVSYPTSFALSGNPNDPAGWSQVANSSLPSDSRGNLSLEDENLPAGSNVCYDFALIYARDAGNDNLQNVNSLISLANTAKSDFASMTEYNCDQVTLGIEQLDESQIGLFPNPTSGEFMLSFGDQAIDAHILITDMSGRIVLKDEINNSIVKILTLDNVSGIYNVIIKTHSTKIHKRLIKVE